MGWVVSLTFPQLHPHLGWRVPGTDWVLEPVCSTWYDGVSNAGRQALSPVACRIRVNWLARRLEVNTEKHGARNRNVKVVSPWGTLFAFSTLVIPRGRVPLEQPIAAFPEPEASLRFITDPNSTNEVTWRHLEMLKFWEHGFQRAQFGPTSSDAEWEAKSVRPAKISQTPVSVISSE
jgi:hypothetical protein